jgi:chromosome segregation ATPase
MTVTRETLDGVKKFARSFQHVIDLADKLESIDAINRLEVEAKAQLADTNAKAAAAAGSLADLKAAVKDAEDTLAALKWNGEEVAQRATLVANEARRDAQKIIADARAEAQAEFDQRMADAKKAQAEAEKLISGLRGEVSRAEALLASKQADLAAVQGQIDKAKAHIASILKGV